MSRPDEVASPLAHKPGSTGAAGRPAAPPTPQVKPSVRLQAGFTAMVLLLAALGYSVTGSAVRIAAPSADAASTTEGASAPASNATPTPAEVMAVVERLALRLKDKPDDAAGWTLLARAYTAMGRYAEALPAFEKVLELSGESADLLADHADALVAQNRGQLNGEAAMRIERALTLEPDNRKALALAGSAAFDMGDYAGAVRYWERVERTLPEGSPLREQLRGSIVQARHLGRLPALAPPGPTTVAATESANTPAPGQASALSGSVTLAAELTSRVNPEDTVFVTARALDGSRIPLAVLRAKAKDLPLRFTLDDSMAMAPGAKISDHAQVVVHARVSKSGEANPRPGDLTGQTGTLMPGASGIALRIAEVVER